MRHLVSHCLLIMLLVLALPVQAAAKNVPVVREHILNQLQQAQKLIDDGNYAQSFELLNTLAAGKLSQYELSQVYQLTAFQYYRSEQYRKAITYYQKMLSLQKLPDFTRSETLYSLVQLFFTLQDYVSANENLALWFKANPDPAVDAYELQGQIFYQLKQYPAAIKSLLHALEKNRAQNKPPRQSWLQMLQAMYYDLGDIEHSIQAARELIHYYPKKTYWLQLAGLYGEKEQKRDQLAVLDAAYVEGLLDRESELKTLAYLYIEQKVPYKAAIILQQAMDAKRVAVTEKNLELLASAWRMAKEIKRSINTLQQAAELSSDGRVYAQLAQLYLVDEQYDKAETAAQQALDKGVRKQVGKMYTTLGIALLKQEKMRQAKQAFEKAKQDPDARKLAVQWEAQLKDISIN
jgi:tetratricopeptide (TPR) repeat protein